MALCANQTHFANWSNAQNASDAHARWQLCVSRNYYNVILSEYRTKEITSALLGLITVCDRKKKKEKKPECRSDRISQDRILEAACISAYIIKNKSTGTGVSRIQCKIIHEGLWPIRFCDLIRIFLEFGLAGRGPAVFVSQNLMSQNLVEHRQTPNVPF